MDQNLLRLLQRIDTPTVCNAIEIAQGSRDFLAFTRGTMVSSAPDAPPIVGFARTAKVTGAAPPDVAPDEVMRRRKEYYRSMAAGPRPAVAVVEDLDWPECCAAWWGEVNTNVHRGLGLDGALTNGVVRDLGVLPDKFPVIAGSFGPSHLHVRVAEIGTEVSIFGLSVKENDLIHADRHGAVVVPKDLLDRLGGAVDELYEHESYVLRAAQRADFDIDMLEEALDMAMAARR